MKEKIQLLIPEGVIAGLEKIDVELSRINVVLGANGAGKSKLINYAIASRLGTFGASAKVIYVEGGRALRMPGYVLIKDTPHATLKGAERVYESDLTGRLGSRIGVILHLLYHRHQAVAQDYLQVSTIWKDAGRVGGYPEPPVSPMQTWFDMFNNIFPDIKLDFSSEDLVISCHKNGSQYRADELSDGERQVLALLGDMIAVGVAADVYLVDEPELNLNPELACRLWDYIESQLPNTKFLYATHCLSFAFRASVDKCLVLGGARQGVVVIENILEVDHDELRHFLGSVPAILSHEFALAVEGDERSQSFDASFYPWIVGDGRVIAVCVGGCNEVRATSIRQGIWERISTGVRIVGVVDRDYRNDKLLEDLAHDQCLILPYHEAESYLCMPRLLVALAGQLGMKVPTEEDVRYEIAKFLRENMLKIVARRVSQSLAINVGVSIPSAVLQKMTNEATLGEYMKSQAKIQIESVEAKLGENNVASSLKKEFQMCSELVNSDDIDSMLKILPGKELLAKLAPLVGCSNASHLLNACIKHIKVEEFEHLNILRQEIRSRLGL